MKSLLCWLGAGVLIVSLSAARARAQSCVTFQADYGVYTDLTSDGTNVYTSVELDGSGQMTANPNAPGCILPPVLTHTPWTYNLTAGVGGWSEGTPQCPDCYLDSTNDQSIPVEDACLSDSVNGCEFEYSAEVYCSLAGVIFNIGWPSIQFELASTKSKWNNTYTTASGGAVQCFVTQWCTVASQPPLCNPPYVIQEPFAAGGQASCWQYYETLWIGESLNGGPWSCIPLIFAQNAIGTSDSSVMSCTKQP